MGSSETSDLKNEVYEKPINREYCLKRGAWTVFRFFFFRKWQRREQTLSYHDIKLYQFSYIDFKINT